MVLCVAPGLEQVFSFDFGVCLEPFGAEVREGTGNGRERKIEHRDSRGLTCLLNEEFVGFLHI